jgi:hypothetical protein
MRRSALAIGTWLASASAAAAHPGHGLAAEGWLHWATEPLHVAPPALLALAGMLLWRARRRRLG